MVVLIKVLVDTHATGCKTQQLSLYCRLKIRYITQILWADSETKQWTNNHAAKTFPISLNAVCFLRRNRKRFHSLKFRTSNYKMYQ
jgi:hypothetical protein